MLLHAAYVDATLRGDTTLAQLIPGFLAPDNKDFLRAMVKLLGDYGEEKVPAAHTIAFVSYPKYSKALREKYSEIGMTKLTGVREASMQDNDL